MKNRNNKPQRKHGRQQACYELLKPKQAVLLGGLLALVALVIGTFFRWPIKPEQQELMTPIEASPTPIPVVVEDVPEATPITEQRPVLEVMKSYLEQNEDTVGKIKIEDTVIDYPVTYGGDNEFYMTHDFDKKKSKAGSIFLDYRCDTKNPMKNMILYGHHMKDGSMFADLMKFKDETFFKEHPIIHFDTLYEELKWEVFAAYVTDTSYYYINTDFHNDEEWLDFIRTCQDKSQYQTDIELKADDVLLTLSTCTYEYDDARYVVQARLIRE